MKAYELVGGHFVHHEYHNKYMADGDTIRNGDVLIHCKSDCGPVELKTEDFWLGDDDPWLEPYQSFKCPDCGYEFVVHYWSHRG